MVKHIQSYKVTKFVFHIKYVFLLYYSSEVVFFLSQHYIQDGNKKNVYGCLYCNLASF